jgi:thioredoxin 1
MSIKITDSNFEGLISDGITLIDFKAPWCTPCTTLSPIIDEISNEYPNVKVGKMDVDENSTIPMKLGIKSIPTIIIYKNGEIMERKTGSISKQQIKSMLDAQLSS